MATNLKNYLTPNIGTSNTTIYNPTATGIQSTIIGLHMVNTTTSSINVSVTLTSGATTVYIIKNVAISSNNTLDVLGNSKLIVEKDDVLQALSSIATSLDVTVSAVEVS